MNNLEFDFMRDKSYSTSTRRVSLQGVDHLIIFKKGGDDMPDRPPIGIPRLLPEGNYKFKITDVKETDSTYDTGSYWRIFFIVKSDHGEHSELTLSFSPKMDRYNELLDAIGVKPNERGFRIPPENIVGCEFMGRIFQRRAVNDKNKTVNDIEKLKPCKPAKVDEVEREVESSYESEEPDTDQETEDQLPDSLNGNRKLCHPIPPAYWGFCHYGKDRV